VLSLEGLAALKEAQVIVCCVDSAEARFAVNFAAQLYLKPLLDIGTAVLDGADLGDTARRSRRIGADVRLVTPGRCLLCFGGIRPATQQSGSDEWRVGGRTGSLRSLNQIAVGQVMRLIEEYAGGRLAANTWLQTDYAENGLPSMRLSDPVAPRSCPGCFARAMGDAGLYLLPGAMAREILSVQSRD
jgi:hypothetical protein